MRNPMHNSYHPAIMRTVSIEYTDQIGATYTIEFTATHRDALFICQEYALRFGVSNRTIGITLRDGWHGEFDANDLLDRTLENFLFDVWLKDAPPHT